MVLHDLQSVLRASVAHEINAEAAAQLRAAVPDLDRAHVKVRRSFHPSTRTHRNAGRPQRHLTWKLPRSCALPRVIWTAPI